MTEEEISILFGYLSVTVGLAAVATNAINVSLLLVHDKLRKQVYY